MVDTLKKEGVTVLILEKPAKDYSRCRPNGNGSGQLFEKGFDSGAVMHAPVQVKRQARQPDACPRSGHGSLGLSRRRTPIFLTTEPDYDPVYSRAFRSSAQHRNQEHKTGH